MPVASIVRSAPDRPQVAHVVDAQRQSEARAAPSTICTRLVATIPISAMNGGTPAPLMTVAFLIST